MPSGNFSYVIDSSFQPFSMQEMLVPFSAYKDAYEKSEEQYNDLSEKSDKFKYLSETLPEGSKARKLYEGYANDLAKQAEDLAHNGLSMSNRRALTTMRRRYQGEIGRLLQADEAMREEKKLRRSLSAQDSSMLYAIDNLDIDSFLDGETPNLYNISGNELYTRGAEVGKAASSRVVNVGEGNITLGGYYRDLVSKYGYSPELLNKFRNDMNAIPELKAAFDDYMNASGVNQNLTGYSRGRAAQYFINGVLNGAIYQENHNPTRDLGVLTPGEKAQIDMQQKQFNLSKSQLDARAASMGYKVDDNGNLKIDPERMKALQELKKAGKGKSGSSSSNSGQSAIAKNAITITWKGNPNDGATEVKTARFKDDDDVIGNGIMYDDLPKWARDQVDNYVGNSNVDLYQYFYQPYAKGTFSHDDEVITVVPSSKIVKDTDPTLDPGAH